LQTKKEERRDTRTGRQRKLTPISSSKHNPLRSSLSPCLITSPKTQPVHPIKVGIRTLAHELGKIQAFAPKHPVYSCPPAAEMKYYKLCGLKPCRFVSLLFWKFKPKVLGDPFSAPQRESVPASPCLPVAAGNLQ
jgi:hypothetical protein